MTGQRGLSVLVTFRVLSMLFLVSDGSMLERILEVLEGGRPEVQLSQDCEAPLGTAESKLDAIWEKVMASTYKPKTDPIPSSDLAKFLIPYRSAGAFRDCGDEIKAARAPKAVHRRGIAFKAKWVVAPNSLRYTGIFQTGCPHGIARLSYGAPPVRNEGGIRVLYGFAMKCLLNDQESEHLFGLPRYTFQNSLNYFQNNISNTLVPSPSMFLEVVNVFMSLAKYLAQSTHYFPDWSRHLRPHHLSLIPWAKVGTPENFKAPESVLLVPSDEIRRIYAENGEDINVTDFRVLLNGKGKDVKIFDVYAMDKDGDSPVKIAELQSVSAFVCSTYGDQTLYFRHPF